MSEGRRNGRQQMEERHVQIRETKMEQVTKIEISEVFLEARWSIYRCTVWGAGERISNSSQTYYIRIFTNITMTHLFPQLRVNSRTDWVLQPWVSNGLVKDNFEIKPT